MRLRRQTRATRFKRMARKMPGAARKMRAATRKPAGLARVPGRIAEKVHGVAQDHPRTIGSAVLATGAVAGGVASLRDPRRRRETLDRALAAGRRAVGRITPADPGYDDGTLSEVVKRDMIRNARAPQGAFSVSVSAGVVELRGLVQRPEDVKAFGKAAAKVPGVKGVHNLLHTPGSPPKAESVTSPDEAKARAEQRLVPSRLSES